MDNYYYIRNDSFCSLYILGMLNIVDVYKRQELERILNEEGDEITALVMEPLVQAAAGMLVMPHGYLKRVRELTEQHDVFLIVDEVATGFGRTGKFFACEHEGVSPDFMTLSKGITGGYLPLAATLTTQRVFDAFLGTFEEKKTFYPVSYTHLDVYKRQN